MTGTPITNADGAGQNVSGFGRQEPPTDIYKLIEGLLKFEPGPEVVMITTDGDEPGHETAFLRMLRENFEVVIIGAPDPIETGFADIDSTRRMLIMEEMSND